MSESQSKTVTLPFVNKGINQRVDPQLLADGEYQSMLNVCSIQEGSVSSRSGYKKLGVSTGYDSPHTIRKVRVHEVATDFDTLNPRYIGEGEYVLRTTDYSSFTSVADGACAPSEARAKRFAVVPYNAGTSGDPYAYFATPLRMLKDYGSTPYSTLAPWGLLPPSCPAVAVVGNALTVNVYTTTSTAAVTTTTTNVIASTTFTAKHLGQFTSLVPSGSVSTFYDNDDYIETVLSVQGVTADNLLEELKLELDASSTGGYWDDYYSKSIIPSELSEYALDVSTAQDATYNRTKNYDDGIIDIGTMEPVDSDIGGGAPITIPPFPDILTGYTVQIPKKNFLKVGRAGTSSYNWSSIRAVRLTGRTSVGQVTITADYVKLVGGSGPNAYAEAALPYKYLYTYRNPTTGAESNPCVPMIDESAVYPNKQPVTVSLFGTAQVGVGTTAGSMAIYRSGGVFADGFYRLVGYDTNPGTETTITFTDSLTDVEIKNRRTVDFDNDPPIPSYLPQPFQTSTLTGMNGNGSGWQTWTATFTPASTLSAVLSPGSLLSIDEGVNSESAIVHSLTDSTAGTGSIVLYAQRTHSEPQASCNVRAASSAYLAASAYDSIWVAGDDNNPHIIYRSKRGRPEAFPFANATTGQVLQYAAGSPSNRIMNLTEFKGVLISLNNNSIFEITPDNEPREVVSGYGLYARWAWCKTESEIWYLSHDGIYSWNGGLPQKRSEKVDWIFRGRTINGILPLDWTKKDYMQMGYFRNKVHLLYQDTSGFTKRLIYDIATDRWTKDDKPYIAFYVEEDTGHCIGAIAAATASAGAQIVLDDQYGVSLAAGTSDGFTDTATATDGTGIAWSLKTPSYSLGDPSLRKLWQDIALEITKPDTACTLTASAYFDYATTAASSWTLGPGGTTISAARQIVPLPLGQDTLSSTYGVEAKAVSFEFACSTTTQQCTLHSLQFTYAPLANEMRGRIEDWSDLGYPFDKRLRTVTLDYDTKGQTVTASMDCLTGINGSTETLAADSLVFTGRGQKTFQVDDGIVAKKVRLRPNVPSSAFLVLKEPQWDYEKYPPDVCAPTDWEDSGSPHEKRVMLLDADLNTNGQTITFSVESEIGTLQSFTASSTLATRNQQFSFDTDRFARKLRIVPGTITGTAMFQLFGHQFTALEQPPDIIEGTEWQSWDHDQYFQQLLINVNTNNQIVPVTVQVEGSLPQVISIQTTRIDCTREYTLMTTAQAFPVGKRARIQVGTIPAGGRFQLYSMRFVTAPADRGDVVHTGDWDLRNWPYDKKFKSLTMEYDRSVTDTTTTAILIDTLSGLDGSTETSSAATFALTGYGRSVQTFQFTDEFVAKAIRVRPNGTATTFKVWSYQTDHENYPPDKTLYSDWFDDGYACDKIFRGLGLTVDTGGIAATVVLQVDGTATSDTWTVTTTASNRSVFLSPNTSTEICGKRYRIAITPGTGGKFQLFKMDWKLLRDACEFVTFDTGMQAFGSAGYRYIKELFFDYKCSGVVTVSVYNSLNQLIHAEVLPANPYRTPARFFLPAVSGTYLNKSTKHRILVQASAATPVKIYRDSCRCEVMFLSADARRPYLQSIIWQDLPIAV